MEATERDPFLLGGRGHVGVRARGDRSADLFGGTTMTKKKIEPVGLEQSIDPALLNAAIQIGASIAMKHGVMKPTPSQAGDIADTAMIYARAIMDKARG